MSKDDVGIVIPGFHMKATSWRKVMFGKLEKGEFGRIPKSLQIALRDDAKFVYWGGGADAEETIERARQAKDELSEALGADVSRFMQEPIAFVGSEGTRTKIEMTQALMRCESLGIGRLHLVSDKVHYLRCMGYLVSLRDAMMLEHIRLDVFLSMTTFSDKEPRVAEPPTDYRDNLYDPIVRLIELDVRLNGRAPEVKRRLLEFIATLEGGTLDMDGLAPSVGLHT